jgi:hypothetical protein
MRNVTATGPVSQPMLLAVLIASIAVMALVIFDPAWRVDARYNAEVVGRCIPSADADGTCTVPVRLPNGRRVSAIVPLRDPAYAPGETIAIERHRSLIFDRASHHADIGTRIGSDRETDSDGGSQP